MIGREKMLECDLRSYWKRVGFVMQRSSFFKDSVKANMNLFQNCTEGQLDEVARCLDLHEEIQGLPDAWDTEIRSEPCNFSEGQMRRLDIMRNVLKDPDILIFDEATANIDGKRREDFYALLHTLSEHKIIIYSTHNKDELAEADVVINLSELCLGGRCD